MLDSHFYPANWGIRPILFNVGSFGVPAYSFFVFLGLAVGILVYYYEARKKEAMTEQGFLIAFGALLGGALGAKILDLAINYQYVLEHLNGWGLLFFGKTIVGGLIGGVIGTLITKKIMGVQEKRGNLFAPAIALGLSIGRWGCFFRGCCYGQATNLPWGVNFGDGVMRHPTQIYESLFMLFMFFYLEKIKNKENVKPGQLFRILMLAYFIFRFLIEFIRTEKIFFYGLSVFQIIAIGVIIYLGREDIKNLTIRLKIYNEKH